MPNFVHTNLNSELGMTVGNWNGTGRQGDWELVGTYPTMEAAREQLSQLQAEGIESRITMIEGLCVIARVKDAARARELLHPTQVV